jgi:hypothetical protein
VHPDHQHVPVHDVDREKFCVGSRDDLFPLTKADAILGVPLGLQSCPLSTLVPIDSLVLDLPSVGGIHRRPSGDSAGVGTGGSTIFAAFESKRRGKFGIGLIVLGLALGVSGCTHAAGVTESAPTTELSSELLAKQPTAGQMPLPVPVKGAIGGAIATATQKHATNFDTLVSNPVSTGAGNGKPAGPVDIELLQPDPRQAKSYASAGVDLVTLDLGWDAYQPTATTTDRSYVAQRVAEAQAYTDAGLEVVLDLGLQYPPAWAFDLPGETRFTNQYGEQWHGGIGTDALDAVWNPAARQAESRYVGLVARDFAGLVDRVRVGGLLSGEIRLPPAHAAGHVDSLWAFGEGALAASPDPKWRPGSGTASQARRWLNFYMASVSEYAVWLTRTVGSAFPATPIDVLLPGWGLRPGDLNRVAAARVSTSAIESTGDDLAGGLDWPRQISALHRLALDVTAVTTWLDAPSYGTAPHDLAPVEYLAMLTRPLTMPLSGENTGGGGQAALARVREQVNRLGLGRVTWMPDHTPGDVTPEDLGMAFPA